MIQDTEYFPLSLDTSRLVVEPQNDSIKLKTKLTLKDKIKAIFPVLSALSFGTRISAEQQKKRLEVCSSCEYLALIDNQPACGICGCQLKIDQRQLINLIRYEETSFYGCKKPGGSAWKKAGV